MILARKTAYRNPYTVERLPALARLHAAAWSPSARMRQELLKLPLRPLFKRLYRWGLGGEGRMTLKVGGVAKSLPFDARNLQFTALYMPQHASGYESDAAALLDALVGPRAVFFDVGSNWGYYALWLAGREGFEGRVHAFEPVPATFADLKGLVSAAGLSEKVFCHELALSDAAGRGAMSIPDELHSGLATVSQGGGIPIALARLDELGLPDPEVMKVDAEDHEEAVFSGGRATLERAKPHVVFESAWGRLPAARALAPFAFLQGLGYSFFHPAWLGAGVLGLVPFEPYQRFLLKEHLNVLACHRDRLPALKALFPDSPGAILPP